MKSMSLQCLEQMLTGEKSKLAAAGWQNFMQLAEASDPIIQEETDLLVYAITQPPGDMIRDHAFFEIGFRFALHCLEQGNLQPLGSNN
jgi:hypothetical protein